MKSGIDGDAVAGATGIGGSWATTIDGLDEMEEATK